MAGPARAPQGVQTVSVVNANLFTLAEQYLGDASQWDRIADLNAVGGVPPDYLITGPVTLAIPATSSGAGQPSAGTTIERMLFGADS